MRIHNGTLGIQKASMGYPQVVNEDAEGISGDAQRANRGPQGANSGPQDAGGCPEGDNGGGGHGGCLVRVSLKYTGMIHCKRMLLYRALVSIGLA